MLYWIIISQVAFYHNLNCLWSYQPKIRENENSYDLGIKNTCTKEWIITLPDIIHPKNIAVFLLRFWIWQLCISWITNHIAYLSAVRSGRQLVGKWGVFIATDSGTLSGGSKFFRSFILHTYCKHHNIARYTLFQYLMKLKIGVTFRLGISSNIDPLGRFMHGAMPTL
jgi:hypothetical protein